MSEFILFAYCALVLFLLWAWSYQSLSDAIARAELNDFATLLANLRKSYRECMEAIGEELAPVLKRMLDNWPDITKGLSD